MKNLVLLFLILTSLLSAQEKNTISGTIKDASNGETVFGASVYFKDTTIGVMSNEYGFFSITAPKGTYNLVISYLGYADMDQEIILDKDQKITFEISESSTTLNEVVITTSDTELVSIRKPQMSVSKLKMGTIKKMPAVLGEIDILKSIILDKILLISLLI